MRIAGVEKHDTYYWRVTFERDGDHVSKYIRLGDCQRAVYRPGEYPEVFWGNVRIAAREANRDFIVKQHGGDVRKHPDWSKDLGDLLSDSELAKLT